MTAASSVMDELTCSRPSRQSDDDILDELTDLDNKKSDDAASPTGPSSYQPATKSDALEIYCPNTTILWTDEHGDLRNTDSLDLEIVMDNTANTFFLRLFGEICIHSSKSSIRRFIYLYIRPEIIDFITYHNDNNTRSLCFSLQRTPDLVTPKDPISAKPRSKALLDAIVALSNVIDFTVRLNSSDTTPSSRLKKVASAFMPRPTWNAELSDLSGLYEGKGVQIVNASISASNASTASTASTDSEAQPPPYRSAFKKRKRDVPDLESNLSSAKSDMPPLNVMLGQMEKRIIKSIRELGERLGDVDPCRYGTEEREDILAEVSQRCDDEFIGLKIESTDVIEEVKEEVERVLNQVDDDVKERIEVIEDDLDARMKSLAEEAAEKYVKETLLNASWRMDGTMSLQRQI